MYLRRTASGRIKCEIHLPNGKKFTRTFDTKRDAEAWGHANEASRDRGDFLDPSRGRIRFSEWAAEMSASSQHLAESTKSRNEIAIRTQLLPHLGDYRIAGIDHEAVQRLVNDLVSAGYAPATVRKSYNVLSTIMRRAVSAGRIAKSPCFDIQLPRLEPVEMRFLSAPELHSLAGEIDDRFYAFILSAGYLGLRWSELVALRTGDVMLPAGRLSVTHTLVEVNGRFYEGSPKTTKGTRSMTIPRFVADVLGEHIGRFATKNGRVFSSPQGDPLRKSFARRHFRPAADRADLLPLRIHDLRHTAAGLMILMGAHPKVIQERLGHSSIKVTLDTYGHRFPDLDEALATGLDELARGAAAASQPPRRADVVAIVASS